MKNYELNENGLPVGEGLFPKKGSPYIWAKVYVNGRQLPFSTKVPYEPGCDWRKALKIRDVEKERLNQPHAVGAMDRVTIEQLMENYIHHLEVKNAARGEYKPATAYIVRKCYEKHLQKPWGGIRALKLTTLMIDTYRKTRLAQGATPNTVDHELGYVRSAMYRGDKNSPKMFNRHLTPDFKIDKANASTGARSGLITDVQYALVLPHLPDFLQPMFAFCKYTGARKKEARFVRRAMVNFSERKVILKASETKKQKERILGVPERAWSIISRWEEQTKHHHPNCKFLFHVNGGQLTTAHVDQAFSSACLAAGLGSYRMKDGEFILTKNRRKIIDKQIHWHDSRRSFTTEAGRLEGVTDLDRGRVAGQTSATLGLYDQNDSAERIQAGFDRKHSSLVDVPVLPVVVGWKAEVRELKVMFDEGVLTAEEFAMEKLRVMGSRHP